MKVKTLKLNLMLSYPVNWTKWQVLRDLIQNFYDDAGYRRFGKSFHHCHLENTDTKGTLTLSMKSAGFNYEWLVHIGATTKQETHKKYAGFYGEGFKLAAMCALRDYAWTIKVRSRNWHLSVTTIDTPIDGKVLRQLAYRIEDDIEHSNQTIITIENFCKEDLPTVEAAKQNFYYPENPLLGELIWKDDSGSVYERSESLKPKDLPISFDCGGEGIVFLSYQARGSFIAPVAICNHYFKTRDRDRKTIGKGTVQDVIVDLSYTMSPQAAMFLLNSLRKFWYSYPDSRKDVESWYATIRKLIIRMSKDVDVVRQFREQNPHLVVSEQPTNNMMISRRSQALDWHRTHHPELTPVQESFSLLGYKSIIDVCEAAGGFSLTREPFGEEVKALEILRNAAKDILTDFVCEYPPCLVIHNESSNHAGMAHLVVNKKKNINREGYRIRYSIQRIEIKKRLLDVDSFTEAFATYCHELCHCFGGDASKTFSNALTDVIALTIQKQSVLATYHEQWKNCFGK
jgi:hypothetical protein